MENSRQMEGNCVCRSWLERRVLIFSNPCLLDLCFISSWVKREIFFSPHFSRVVTEYFFFLWILNTREEIVSLIFFFVRSRYLLLFSFSHSISFVVIVFSRLYPVPRIIILSTRNSFYLKQKKNNSHIHLSNKISSIMKV